MKLYVTDPLVMCYMAKNFEIKFERKGCEISYISSHGFITYNSASDTNIVYLSEFIDSLKDNDDKKIYIKPESNSIILEAKVLDVVFAPVTGKYYKIHPSHHRPDMQEIEKDKFGRGAYKNAIIVSRNKVSTLFENVMKEQANANTI